MKMTPSRWGVLLAIALWTGSAAAEEPQEAPPPPIQAGGEYDYAPFCIVREDKQADGFSIELMRAALAAVGREVVFKTAPWPELKNDLAEGRLQALPMVARSAEREGIYDFTFPYYTMHGTIVVRENNTDIRGPADLAGERVAVLQEDIAHEYLRRNHPGATIVPLPSFTTALQELSEGKHDAVVIQKLLAYQIMRESGIKNLRTVGPPLSGFSQVFCFAVREGDDELLSLLNEGLSIVMADGTFRRLHAKWFASLEELEHAKSRIVVGGDIDYPPYEFLDANGQPAGFNVDLTKAIARHAGLSVDIRLAPWAQVRAGLERGEINAVQGMFYSADRDRIFTFSPAHSLVHHVIVVRNGSPPLSDLQALKGKSILVMAGDLMHDLALQHGLETGLVPVGSQEEALRRLAAGEHDCALVARVPALYWIRQNHWSNLSLSGPLLSAELCYSVPHGKEALLAEFADGLATVMHSVEYRDIQAKWLAPYEDDDMSLRTILNYVLLGAAPVLVLLGAALLWTRSLQAQVDRRTRELRSETEFLRMLGEGRTVRETVQAAVGFLQPLSGCEAVGVRLKDGDDYPYFATRGFPSEFVQRESSLCARDAQGNILRDPAGRPVLDCMCGNVISGRIDPSQPFFTKQGSYWSNGITDAHRLAAPRDCCNSSGYESVALVPLRMGDQRIGLIQFNDHRPGLFTPEGIAQWERMATALAVTLAKAWFEEELRQLNAQLEQRVSRRTAQVEQQAERLRALATDLSQTEHRERKRLAKVLHDHIQQLLVAARMQLELMLRDDRPERLHTAVHDVGNILKEAIDASRSLTIDLSPPALYESGLIGGLRWLAARMLEKNRLTVHLNSDAGVEPASEETRLLLFECVRELLFNAVKHAGVSEATVTLGRTDGAFLKIAVTDAGKGFDPARLQNRSPSEATFGIFSIQQRLTHIGGSMEIVTAPGQGTQITLLAPIGKSVESKEETSEVAKRIERREVVKMAKKSEQYRVLVVDDHAIMREGLTGLLQFEPDIEVVGQAGDGHHAVQLAQELAPDVVIMDINLNGMSGLEVTRAILAQNPRINVIGLSMHEESDMAKAMREAGAVAYLTKGGPSEDLIAAVRTHGQHAKD